MQEQHMEGEMLNKVPLVQDRSALDKPASSSIPYRAVERGSAFSPYCLYTTVFLKIHSFLCSPYRPQVQPKSEEPQG